MPVIELPIRDGNALAMRYSSVSLIVIELPIRDGNANEKQMLSSKGKGY